VQDLSLTPLDSTYESGIDPSKRILCSPGMRPILPNTTPQEVEAFRRQAEPVDMVGCTDVALIAAKVGELFARASDRAVRPSG
jgi:tetrahydromethanopterin S-methyltransferase subunit A